ncbi:MAG TPA: hypothetical protein VHD55_01475 [Candidatus Paceibacterota bacterium]|nr:hypothetical protein [Candidatus Paceibacterota bacterium]
MNLGRLSDLVLRASLAFAFLYPPLDALRDPDTWLGYFPGFMHGIVPDAVLLHGFGLFEAVIALWILSGWKIIWPCALALLTLLAIVGTHLHGFDTLFRDVSIAGIALALMLTRASRAGAQAEG